MASLQSLLQMVPDVIVQGIPTVERAVISKDEKDNNRSAAMPCQGLCAVHFALLNILGLMYMCLHCAHVPVDVVACMSQVLL